MVRRIVRAQIPLLALFTAFDTSVVDPMDLNLAEASQRIPKVKDPMIIIMMTM